MSDFYAAIVQRGIMTRNQALGENQSEFFWEIELPRRFAQLEARLATMNEIRTQDAHSKIDRICLRAHSNIHQLYRQAQRSVLSKQHPFLLSLTASGEHLIDAFLKLRDSIEEASRQMEGLSLAARAWEEMEKHASLSSEERP